MIHIGRAGANLGSFSEDEVRQGLATGRFFPSDLGWKEGMENWAPLSQFSEFAAPVPPLPVDAPPEEADAEPAGLPWDDRRERGFVTGFGETAWLVLTNPSGAFARMRTDGGVSGPLLYCLIGGWMGMIAAAIYAVLITRMQGNDLSGLHLPADMAANAPGLQHRVALMELKLCIVIGWLMVMVSILISSAIGHLFLMLAGGANKPFHVTLRVFCFSYGSTQLLQFFPFCGSPLAFVWLMVCCVIGLAHAHGTTTGRSLTAMLLFFAAAFLCCVGIFALALSGNYDALRPMLGR